MKKFDPCLTTDGYLGNNKVGVWISENKIVASFPKNMSPDKNNIRLLINVLEKYERTRDRQHSVIRTGIDSNTGQPAGQFRIGTLFNIMDDFLHNGYYISRTDHYHVNGSGKIDFKRTLRKSKPVLYNGDLIYTDLQTKTKRTYAEELLHIIHKYVVSQAADLLSFYYRNISVEEHIVLPVSIKECIIYLRNELFQTHNDYKRKIITWMLSYLEGSSDTEDYSYFIETSYFDIVWEEMLRVLLSNISRSDYFFNTKWLLLNNLGELKEKSNSQSQIDGIRIEMDEDETELKVYVIDAKYFSYNGSNRGTLPQTTDINKQIGYMYYTRFKIEEIYRAVPSKKFFNIFILPYTKEEKLDNSFKFFGIAKSEMDPGENIIGIFGDVKTIMEQYVNPNKKEALVTDFKREIQSYKKNIKDKH